MSFISYSCIYHAENRREGYRFIEDLLELLLDLQVCTRSIPIYILPSGASIASCSMHSRIYNVACVRRKM